MVEHLELHVVSEEHLAGMDVQPRVDLEVRTLEGVHRQVQELARSGVHAELPQLFDLLSGLHFGGLQPAVECTHGLLQACMVHKQHFAFVWIKLLVDAPLDQIFCETGVKHASLRLRGEQHNPGAVVCQFDFVFQGGVLKVESLCRNLPEFSHLDVGLLGGGVVYGQQGVVLFCILIECDAESDAVELLEVGFG